MLRRKADRGSCFVRCTAVMYSRLIFVTALRAVAMCPAVGAHHMGRELEASLRIVIIVFLSCSSTRNSRDFLAAKFCSKAKVHGLEV